MKKKMHACVRTKQGLVFLVISLFGTHNNKLNDANGYDEDAKKDDDWSKSAILM